MSREQLYKDIISGKRRGWMTSALRFLLWILSFPYGWIVSWRNGRFDRGGGVSRSDCFVISIGNLTTGGTGKTPLVCYFAGKLRELELRVAILSRGYGANVQGVNDEALELEIRLPDVPHLQDPNRKKMADIASAELESEILILDDGFQHRQLHRDLDILVIDATQPFGHEFLLPRGLLREPVRNLKRADLIVLNRCNFVSKKELALLKERIRSIQPEILITEAETVATELFDCQSVSSNIDTLPGSRCLAFCGIGNPDGFRTTLDKAEVDLVNWRQYPDHHLYSRDDIEDLKLWVESHPECEMVLCTHKDLVKINLSQIAGKPLRAILISSQIRLRERSLWKTINTKMQQPPG
ncbi:MAG: tetraacyldisaccharide 4'-kinase [Planctomycetota bacterium]|nr:tetraacyldisaccharide 4'-kinase [Planctomycetota bacterium]